MKNLQLKNVSLAFKNTERPILNNISFDIYPNDFVIILGSNGSGKSSLLKLIDRRYKAISGNILLNKKSIHDYSSKEYKNHVATLTQSSDDSLFSSFSVYENYRMHTNKHLSKKQSRDFFADHLTHFNKNLCGKLDTCVAKLSGGEKQALALALIFLNPPKILLLDEHTSALDPKTAEQIMLITDQMIQKHAITCLMTTHNLSIAKQFGNKILGLKCGEICLFMDDKQTLRHESLLTQIY